MEEKFILIALMENTEPGMITLKNQEFKNQEYYLTYDDIKSIVTTAHELQNFLGNGES